VLFLPLQSFLSLRLVGNSLPSQVFLLEEGMETADMNGFLLVFTILTVAGECRFLFWLKILKSSYWKKE
jgi:hypothetical protein